MPSKAPATSGRDAGESFSEWHKGGEFDFMDNPWLRIPLSDYEGHMSLPNVAQDRLLSDVFASALDRYEPRSVAVLGCAGGNGFERISPETTRHVIGVDINPEYVTQARTRFAGRLPRLELFVGDVQTETFDFEPVELLYAGLLFEYVDVGLVLSRIRTWLVPDGLLLTVVQLPAADLPEVTPSPYVGLGALASIMRLVRPDVLSRLASDLGYREIETYVARSAAGKRFQVLHFRMGDAKA